MPHPTTLIVPAQTQSIRLAQALTRELASTLAFDDSAHIALSLAVEEALVQIIGQSFPDGETGDVEVVLDATPSGLSIVFKDRGLPFDFAGIPDYDPHAASLTEASDAGLSKFLLTHSVDEVRFRNLGRGGTELELIKRYSTQSISEYPEPVLAPAPHAGETVTEVRRFQPEDAIAISRLVYLSYGNSYVNDDLYYPERIVALHEEGMLQSFVAVTGGERLVGHVGLTLPWRGAEIVEWGIAVVDPGFRGSGIMNRLIELLGEELQRRELTGVFAHAVTNHVYSQKLCASHGFGDVALLLGYAPASLIFRKITDAPKQRESTFVAWRALAPLSAPALQLPPAHDAMIRTLYEGIGVSLPATAAPSSPSAGTTQCRSSIASSLNAATMLIDAIGKDYEPALHREARRLCRDRVDMIFAYLDLTAPGAPAACAALERIGFFFAGVFPGHPFTHTLVLQYPNNLTIDCAQVKAFSPLAQQLRDYVAKEQEARG